jgi:uncharacterized protein (TIGR02246 family)
MFRSVWKGVAVSAALAALAACTQPSQESTSAGQAAADVAAIQALLVDIERTFEAGDLDAAMAVFADDAVIMGQGAPDVAGAEAIRAMYMGMLEQFAIAADLTSEEIEVAGDLAYERGTYTLKLTQKSDGRVVADLKNRYIHIFKRQPDGAWKEWRMMVNSAEAAPGAP